MAEAIAFTLDGKPVLAEAGETIWDVAKREGLRIPHLCHVDLPGYRTDGNCRACMVEIEGERVLAASCIRKPTKGMSVKTNTERADKARRTVFELLASNMRPAELQRANAELARNYLRNFGQVRGLVPYVIGRYDIIEARELGPSDIFPSGMVALTRSGERTTRRIRPRSTRSLEWCPHPWPNCC